MTVKNKICSVEQLPYFEEICSLDSGALPPVEQIDKVKDRILALIQAVTSTAKEFSNQDLSKIQTFVEKIHLLDQSHAVRPFASAIKQLQERLQYSVRLNSKVVNKVKIFTHQEQPTSITSPVQQKKAKVLLRREKKERFVGNLLQKLTQPTFQPASIIADIDYNLNMFGQEEKKQINIIKQALQKLERKESFSPLPEEKCLLIFWKTSLSQLGIPFKYTKSDIDIAKMQTKVYLKNFIVDQLIKKTSINSLATSLEKILPTLDSISAAKRFINLWASTPSKVNHNQLAKNFALISDHLLQFKKTADEFFENKWDECQEVCDRKTEGKFSKIAPHLGYVNILHMYHEKVYDMLFYRYLKIYFNSHLILHKSIEETTKHIDNIDMMQFLEESFKIWYYKDYKSDLQWVVKYAHYLKKTFDQGIAKGTNLYSGTCEENSLMRQKVLMENPYIASQLIPLQNTEKERFNHLMKKNIFENYGKNISKKDFSAMEKLYQKTFDRIGIRETALIELKNNSNDDLIKHIIEIMKQNYTKNIILFMHPKVPGESPHAINIQIDLEEQFFRFIDDNLGVFECDDITTFKNGLLSWLSISFPNLTEFAVGIYQNRII